MLAVPSQECPSREMHSRHSPILPHQWHLPSLLAGVGASHAEQGANRGRMVGEASSGLMFQPETLFHDTSLGPLSVSACQILLSMVSCTRFKSPITIPQLCSRARHALPGGERGACPLGSITGLPRTNLVLGDRMPTLPGHLNFQEAINGRHLALEAEMGEDALHPLSELLPYPAA